MRVTVPCAAAVVVATGATAALAFVTPRHQYPPPLSHSAASSVHVACRRPVPPAAAAAVLRRRPPPSAAVLPSDPRASTIAAYALSANGSDDGDGDGDDYISEIDDHRRTLRDQFLSISLPALVQLAAEPLASLVDTAYLGRLGPEVLGGAGVAISAQYAVSKLYNDPLLRTSISLVASQDGRSRGGKTDETVEGGVVEGDDDGGDNAAEAAKNLSVAVSSALLLALSVGLIQLFVYFFLAGGIIGFMGVTGASPMYHSAFSYLRVRSLGTPAATLWLVTNGIFRGLGDTRTPLVYSLFFTGLNAILDPLFIFTFKFGASGAAAGTAIAQYVALLPLLMALNKKVKVDFWGQLGSLGRTLREYLKAGSLVFLRTMGKVAAYSVCARQAVSFIRRL